MSPTVYNQGDALVQAIIEEPADDGLRLIYADWLEDAGQHQRSEFFRVQVELARLEAETGLWSDESGPGQRINALRRRERELFPWGDARGACGLPAKALAGYNTILGDQTAFHVEEPGPEPRAVLWRFVWRRGFPYRVETTCDLFRDYGPSLCRMHPIGKVALTDKEPHNPADGSWTWAYPSPGSPTQHVLPKWLYDLLDENDNPGRVWKRWPTEQDALAALSRAAIRWARAVIGDSGPPPLPL